MSKKPASFMRNVMNKARKRLDKTVKKLFCDLFLVNHTSSFKSSDYLGYVNHFPLFFKRSKHGEQSTFQMCSGCFTVKAIHRCLLVPWLTFIKCGANIVHCLYICVEESGAASPTERRSRS